MFTEGFLLENGCRAQGLSEGVVCTGKHSPLGQHLQMPYSMSMGVVLVSEVSGDTKKLEHNHGIGWDTFMEMCAAHLSIYQSCDLLQVDFF